VLLGSNPRASISRGVNSGSATSGALTPPQQEVARQILSRLVQLNDQECDAIAGLLLNMALCRKTNQRDFGAIYKLLEIGYALGLTDTPASSQAAEMLERLSNGLKLAKPEISA
jgi:hypothetical protein